MVCLAGKGSFTTAFKTRAGTFDKNTTVRVSKTLATLVSEAQSLVSKSSWSRSGAHQSALRVERKMAGIARYGA